jgi:predicted dehydrogenase
MNDAQDPEHRPDRLRLHGPGARRRVPARGPALPRLAGAARAPHPGRCRCHLARGAAERFGFARSTGDWRSLIADPEIDLVDITTPNTLHFPMAVAAIEAGKAVYCEKPLSVSLAEAEQMTAAARKAGVKTMVAFNNIKTPAAMLAKQLIERGDIGRPTRFRGWFDQGFFNDPNLPWSWRCSRREAGSGALGDLGSHVVSVAQYLMGEVVEVAAQWQTFFSTRPKPAGGSGYGAAAAGDAEQVPVENEARSSAWCASRAAPAAPSRPRGSRQARCSASIGRCPAPKAPSSWTASASTS